MRPSTRKARTRRAFGGTARDERSVSVLPTPIGGRPGAAQRRSRGRGLDRLDLDRPRRAQSPALGPRQRRASCTGWSGPSGPSGASPGAPAGAPRSARRGRRAAARARRCRRATRRPRARSRARGPLEPPRSPAPRKKRSNTLSRSSSRDARARRPRPRARRRRSRARPCASTARARVGVAQRVLHQVEHEPVQLVARALDLGARRARRSRSRGRRPRARARRPPRRRPRRGRRARAAAARPASARASSSRSATSRRIRRDGAQRGGGGLALLAVERPPRAARGWPAREVSGVRSSCEASATNSRWRASVASVSARASSSACEHRLQRARQLGDLVLGLRARDRARAGSRVRSISRAASVSSAIGAIARRAVARPASSASAAPPSTPRPRKTLHAVRGRLRRRRAGARTGCSTRVGEPGPRDRRATRPGSRRRPRVRGARRGRSSGASRRAPITRRRSSVTTRIAAFWLRRVGRRGSAA